MSDVERRLLPLDDMREYLCPATSVKTIYNQVSAGSFPIKPIRVGRKLYWDKRKLDAWIEKQQEEEKE